MLRKRFGIVCFIIALAVFFAAGCGKKGESAAGTGTGQITESEAADSNMKKSVSESSTEGTVSSEDGEPDSLMKDQEEMQADETYGGPGTQAEAFAEKIQEAVSDKNLEELAELIAYPCVFINGDQETIILKKQEDLLKLNPDMVFGDDLMVSIAKVDTATLKKSEAGIVMGEGASRIVFQETADGSIGITEMKE
ncbi:hypothetical protein [Lacrimispora sp.]|uniref:hypothetical protein n=1 Tax=Lacrimispora sp. TaxID=2719234 RepID=UPI0032E42F34